MENNLNVENNESKTEPKNWIIIIVLALILCAIATLALFLVAQGTKGSRQPGNSTGCEDEPWYELPDPLYRIEKPNIYLYDEPDYPETDDKPNIYMYSPLRKIDANVKIDYTGELSAMYPLYNNGDSWNVEVSGMGPIFVDGREYNYLYWEGRHPKKYKITSGWCISRAKMIPFLEEQLSLLGLSHTEQDDFISYWLPRLYEHPYNVISFDTTQYEKDANLVVTPTPDTVIRVFMTYYGTDEPVDIVSPEKINTPLRKGFTVVEWGGSEVK